MSKYKVAVFIGRFQPFHNGHLYSLTKCFELADKVIVGIGSSQESRTENNPWNLEERTKMIQALDFGNSDVEIVEIADTTDEEWVEKVKNIIESFGYKKEEVLFVSNNEWVTRLMKEEGYEVYESGLINRDELEGLKIRTLMRKSDDSWKNRVPKEVLPHIDVSAV